jgi:hypothetical protein
MNRTKVVESIGKNPDTIQGIFFVYNNIPIHGVIYSKGLKFDDGHLSSINYLYKIDPEDPNPNQAPSILFAFWKDSLTKVFGKPSITDIDYNRTQADSQSANVYGWIKRKTKIELIQRMDGILLSAEPFHK